MISCTRGHVFSARNKNKMLVFKQFSVLVLNSLGRFIYAITMFLYASHELSEFTSIFTHWFICVWSV